MDITALFILSFIAAFGGTVLMTLSQEIEIRLNKRPISHTPAIAVFKILHLDFERLSERMKGVASYVVHFGYGTVWGFPLAILYLLNVVDFWPLLIIHYVIVLLQGWIVVPLLGIAGPPWTWGWKPVLTEAGHKVIYSVATTLIFLTLL